MSALGDIIKIINEKLEPLEKQYTGSREFLASLEQEEANIKKLDLTGTKNVETVKALGTAIDKIKKNTENFERLMIGINVQDPVEKLTYISRAITNDGSIKIKIIEPEELGINRNKIIFNYIKDDNTIKTLYPSLTYENNKIFYLHPITKAKQEFDITKRKIDKDILTFFKVEYDGMSDYVKNLFKDVENLKSSAIASKEKVESMTKQEQISHSIALLNREKAGLHVWSDNSTLYFMRNFKADKLFVTEISSFLGETVKTISDNITNIDVKYRPAIAIIEEEYLKFKQIDKKLRDAIEESTKTKTELEGKLIAVNEETTKTKTELEEAKKLTENLQKEIDGIDNKIKNAITNLEAGVRGFIKQYGGMISVLLTGLLGGSALAIPLVKEGINYLKQGGEVKKGKKEGNITTI